MNKQISAELQGKRDKIAEKIFNFLPSCLVNVEPANEQYRHNTVFLRAKSSEAPITRKEIESLMTELRGTGIYACSFEEEGEKYNLIGVSERSYKGSEDLYMTLTFAQQISEKPKFGSVSLKEAFAKAQTQTA